MSPPHLVFLLSPSPTQGSQLPWGGPAGFFTPGLTHLQPQADPGALLPSPWPDP